MSANRASKEYEDGVQEFVSFAIANAEDTSKIICPCLECCYTDVSANDLQDHLICNGIDKSYTCWTMHGEKKTKSAKRRNERDTSTDFEKDTNYEFDRVEEILNVIEDDLRDCPKMFERVVIDAETPLYEGCTKFTRLSTVLKLYKLKAGNGWSDRSFTDLLTLLKDILPKNNVLPSRTYEAKRLLCSIGMSYEKIHACPNDCILFRNEYASLNMCPKCSASRYKKNETGPSKALWYFPIIPRFRRMYRNAEDAKNLTWHANERVNDGMLRHPADSPQWAKIDNDYSDFGEETRNLRLALSTDGINPHGIQSGKHTTWPVILLIYNLPPWLCMKRKFMMLTMLISGPTQPGNDIDIYLAPLIEDLKHMWETGVEVYDEYRKESFRLRAMLFGTINDFPAYGNLSGYSVKGKCACPVCEDHTNWIRLEHCQKNVFLGHRRFLNTKHRYRKWKKAFNGESEEDRAPSPLTGDQLYEKVKLLSTEFGKPFSGELVTGGWKKKSIFFELPYWKSLYVRHFLDVMHIEKNVFDSVVGTLLNIPGKSKDGIKARLDMQSMGLRNELRPVKKDGKRTFLPPAAHTLSRKEKKIFCKFLHNVKVPEGYSSNIKSLVSMKDLRLKGLKSHDCHVLMENFLPIGIRSILPENVRWTITKLCFFFKAICSKVIDPEKLPTLQNEIVVTLCELEMYFPPSFFDIMVHLTIHLIMETQYCGPAYMRWMYPIERYMKILKGYVKNRSRPEGCIVERYIVEEAVEFFTDFLSNVESIGLPMSRHSGRTTGEGIGASKLVTISDIELEQAHLYVLHNADEVEPYVEKHKEILQSLNPNRSENWLTREHNRRFISWLKEHVFSEFAKNPDSISERLRWLANGPNANVLSYSSYVINKYTFYTKEHDQQSTMQNSGVTLVAQSLHISSAKDRNPAFAKLSYFGVIEHIWELDYSSFQVPVFGCKWVDNNNGVQVDHGFMKVDLNREGYRDEPFILASQAHQVFYVTDPADEKWSIVLLSNKINDHHDQECENRDVEDDPFFNTSHSLEDEPITDDILYMRNDHNDGIWINPSLWVRKKQKTRTPITRKRKRPT
jgi:hypothetical protein